MSARCVSKHPDGGFSVVEALVALALLAGAITLLQGILGGGATGLRIAAREAQALAVAKARLATAGIEGDLSDGVSSGVEGDVRWQVEVRPAASTGAVPRLTAWWVTARVAWQVAGSSAERELSITTLKLRGPSP